ncbi:MAG: CCA tRNA nucleotidyltransferase [Eubacteriaceae bacterium]
MDFKIPIEILETIRRLESHGFKGYLVGGCVRDFIMEKDPQDFDITTDANPEEIKKCFKSFKILENGIKHGTVTIITGNYPVEITTHRQESGYLDHRRPDLVIFTDKIEEDLKRRDFTINAMSYDVDRGLIDPFGGRQDIQRKRVRCVGEPNHRFSEDALRILRGIRFAGTLGFEIEKNTQNGMFKNRELLKVLSSERVMVEISKFLCGKNVKKIFIDMVAVLKVVIPELSQLEGIYDCQISTVEDLLTYTGRTLEKVNPKLYLRLTMLFLMMGKSNGNGLAGMGMSWEIAQNRLKILKFSSKINESVICLLKNNDIPIRANKISIKKCLNQMSKEGFKDLIQIKKVAEITKENVNWERVRELEATLLLFEEIVAGDECFSRNQLKINGRDLINLNLTNGLEIKRILEILLKGVVEEAIPNEKRELVEKAKELIKNAN